MLHTFPNVNYERMSPFTVEDKRTKSKTIVSKHIQIILEQGITISYYMLALETAVITIKHVFFIIKGTVVITIFLKDRFESDTEIQEKQLLLKFLI